MLHKCNSCSAAKETTKESKRVADVRAAKLGVRGPIATSPPNFCRRRPLTVRLWGNGGQAMMVHISAIGAMGIVATCEFISQVLQAFGTFW